MLWWLQRRPELLVHSKSHFPPLQCCRSELLPFSITLFAQDELQIVPNKQA